ncbi:CHAP domain protein [Candidatus Moduliflexus flocculans]|uniref:CHAP domain protein n=1 Tax=Candidatus Moduliflexus flocculans TaxID=1499966 RepID=A0A081BQT9_9BACT|nr:CHAP domain protein [Candidatus Moduliflexus flocculans]
MNTLRSGDTGDEVKELQRMLQEQGFFKGEIDGKFLAEVKKAVIYFQETHVGSNGEFLDVDGIVGQGTWWALRNPVGEAQKSYLTGSIPAGLTPLRVKQLEIALREHQLGVHEEPNGSNSGGGVEKYGNKKNPWCCYFWSWCNKQCFGSYSLKAQYGLNSAAWKKAQELSMARLKGEYLPIPGDAFMMFYRDDKGKLTNVGHIGFVLRVEVKDGKAVAINTIEGNASNRVKLGKRHLADASIVGFINNFPPDEQPTNWETGLIRATTMDNDSTRSVKK